MDYIQKKSTGTSSDGTVQLSALLFNARDVISLTKNVCASTALLLPGMPESELKTCFAYATTRKGSAT